MKLAIFGASGFAREVRDIAHEIGYEKILYIDKTDFESMDGFQVVRESELNSLKNAGFSFIIGVGSPALRKEIWGRYPDLCYVNLIHPAASFGYGQLKELKKSKGNIVFAGVRLTNSIEIGNFGIYYLNCTVAHDCIIEDFVTISPGANISGNVKLSNGCYIGANACILQGKAIAEKLIVGASSVVGAGSVVTKSIPDNIIVKGVPAR